MTPDEAVALTAARAALSGFFFDFDGTLAPIEEDPDAVQPAPGVVEALHRLTRRVRRVAIVSARPVEFLRSRLLGADGIDLHGLYGLEVQRAGRALETEPEALRWAPLMVDLRERASRELPAGVRVEYKRLSLALHYRRAERHREEVERWSREQEARYGLAAQTGRMVLELRPPVERDKGDVVRGEIGDLTCAWYLGDDISDLEAFRALEEREAAGDGFAGVAVAVANPETGDALARAADFVLDSPADVPGLLGEVTRRLA